MSSTYGQSDPNLSQASALESHADEQFIVYMLEIDSRYKSMTKQDRTRVEQWSKVLCQANSSIVWKKNRNLYAMQLLDSVLNNELIKPYSQPPPARATRNIHPPGEGPSQDGESHGVVQCDDFTLPLLSRTQVTSQLSIRFKHLRLEVDKQRIVNQLTSSTNSSFQEGDYDEVLSSAAELSQHHQRAPSQQEVDLDENPRPQQPTDSVVRPKESAASAAATGSTKRPTSQKQRVTSSRRKKQQENQQQNFQEQHAQLMLQQAEEQLRKYDEMPRPQSDIQTLKKQVYDLKEEKRGYVTQVAQLKTQLEVRTIAEQHMREQMAVKDQMLAMQEEMLNTLNAEVEKLKLMLLAKQQSPLTAQAQQTNNAQHEQERHFTTESTVRMVDTVKAQVPTIIQLDRKVTGSAEARNKQLIVPDQIKMAQRQRRHEQRQKEAQEQQNLQESLLIKSHVSLSDCDERSVHILDTDRYNNPLLKESGVSQDHQIRRYQPATITNDEGATLQLQEYIQSVGHDDMPNFLQDSSMGRSQVRNQRAPQPGIEQVPQEVLQFSESDRFLEEVILSRRPQYGGQSNDLKQIKNEFLPKKASLQPVVEGEMSIQDLTEDMSLEQHRRHVEGSSISMVHPKEQCNRTQLCNKTVDCSCGCEDEPSFAQVNRTQLDQQDIKLAREQREFFAQINTEIASCTQDTQSNYRQQQQRVDNFGESRATTGDGSPARLLDQLLASQGASAFQPNFNYRQHLQQQVDASTGGQDLQASDQIQAQALAQTRAIPATIHEEESRAEETIQTTGELAYNERNADMPMAAQSLATESQFERFYTDLIK